MKRLLVVKDCFQCRYGSQGNESTIPWCHEAERALDEEMNIPIWCPLPLYKGD